jgi:Peptidase family M28
MLCVRLLLVGTGQIIEMARQISDWNVGHTVRVCTWGGEEEGLLGSYYYSQQFRKVLDDTLIFYFNGDMSANEAGYYSLRFEMMKGDPNVPILQEIIQQYYARGTPGLDLSKYLLTVSQRSTPGGSDHQTFILDGFETGRFAHR